MNDLNTGSRAYENYMDAAAELFMEQYAKSIYVPSPDSVKQEVPIQLYNKCTNHIKTEKCRHNRTAFFKNTWRFTKVASAFVVILLALSSFLFMTVDAIRKPILDFYIREQDGHMDISGSPYTLDYTHPYHDAAVLGFNEQDPLAFVLPEDYSLNNIVGTMDDDLYSAIYYNTLQDNYIVFSGTAPDSYHSIDTDDCNITEFEISGNMAVMSENTEYGNIVLMWYNAHLDKMLTLSATDFTGEELILMAEALNSVLYK